MLLRSYRPQDLAAMARLFYDTVQSVNRRDYTAAQVEAWSDGWKRLLEEEERFVALYTVVAEEDGRLAGYGNVSPAGEIDHLYVGAALQGQGIGTKLCDALEAYAWSAGAKRMTVFASKTALPFFIHRGYCIVRENQVMRNGVALVNYDMARENGEASAGAKPKLEDN